MWMFILGAVAGVAITAAALLVFAFVIIKADGENRNRC